MAKNLFIIGCLIVTLGVVTLAVHGCGSAAAPVSTNPTLTIDGASS